MALNQLGLGFIFTAKDLASGVIGRVENALGGVEEKADEAAKKFEEGQTQMRNVGLAIAGAGIAIIGTAAALAVQAGQFEAAIAAAGARSGASSEEMARLHAAAFDASGLGAIVNNSRGIIFAHSRPEYKDRFAPSHWQDAVAAATSDMIAQLQSEIPRIQ